MTDDYLKTLQDQYTWYIDKIEGIYKSNYWKSVPIDSFYYKFSTGSIQKNTNDIEWLETTITKLQSVLALIEKHMEREAYKEKTGVDLMSKLREI